jgi:hypothetical protein
MLNSVLLCIFNKSLHSACPGLSLRALAAISKVNNCFTPKKTSHEELDLGFLVDMSANLCLAETSTPHHLRIAH